MAKNTSVALSERFQDFIREQIASGEYESASEVVRDGLRLLKRQKEAIDPVQAALNESMLDGPARPLNREKFFRDAHRRSDKAKKARAKAKARA